MMAAHHKHSILALAKYIASPDGEEFQDQQGQPNLPYDFCPLEVLSTCRPQLLYQPAQFLDKGKLRNPVA